MKGIELINAIGIWNSRLNLRVISLLIGFLVSIGLYKYVMNNLYSEGDFISATIDYFKSDNDSYNFYSDNNFNDKYSVYFKIGKAVDNYPNGNIKVQVAGKTGTAIENAYLVANNSHSFGLVQSDTYKSVPSLFNEHHLKVISPIYMERIYILYRYAETSEMKKKVRILSSDVVDAEAVKVLKSALLGNTLYTGGEMSSARHYLYVILKYFGIRENDSVDEVIQGRQIGQMVDIVKNGREETSPQVVVMTIGSNSDLHDIINDSDNHIGIIGIDPSDILKMNKEYDLDLKTTHYDLENISFVPTAGVFAQLICSEDVLDYEISNFLEVLQGATASMASGNLFTNPPITISDIKELYEARAGSYYHDLIKSLLIFLISVIATTYVVGNFVIWIYSSFQKAIYYRGIMKIYEAALERNNSEVVSRDKERDKSKKLEEGVIGLNKIGAQIRKDFDTGGITNSDHRYLIDNLHFITGWFRDKIVQRLTYVVSESDTQRDMGSLSEIFQDVNMWHARGSITTHGYQYLIELIQAKMKVES